MVSACAIRFHQVWLKNGTGKRDCGIPTGGKSSDAYSRRVYLLTLVCVFKDVSEYKGYICWSVPYRDDAFGCIVTGCVEWMI